MSVPNKPVILSPAAQVDIGDILLYTQRQWGADQRNRYEEILDRGIAALADYPEASVQLPLLCPGCRARAVERHMLYYRILDDVIEVMRILHARSDPSRHFRS
jgi:toxin ParE1/3/4